MKPNFELWQRGLLPSFFVDLPIRRMEWIALVLIGYLVAPVLGQAPNPSIDFSRDIQPILANHCWSCHGPDETGRQAELRLDIREDAIAKSAIVPGKEGDSQLLLRIHATDDSQIMPPPASKKPLTDKQKALLQSWIQQGAPYSKHWAFESLKKHAPPAVAKSDAFQNDIDAFVLDRLAKEQVKQSPIADSSTLLRRVTLDLTGLPPTLEELNQFLGDKSPSAYEKAVDRLLSSERYAERMAMNWLDLARYADTNGYNNDEDRTMWPWRDWVIRAFHTNMPYDQFIVEQLAGDLLPNPTQDQLVATAFLRNQGHNTEGGIIQEEYRVEYVADRVHTTATVFLGLSMQCARCHDHKYDPITQSEYYQFYAFFNNLDEKQASYSKFVAVEPFIRTPSPEQAGQLSKLDTEISDFRAKIKDREDCTDELLRKWLTEHSVDDFKNKFGLRLLHQFSLNDASTSTIADSVSSATSVAWIGQPQTKPGKKGNALEFDGKSHIDLGDVANFDGNRPFSIAVWVNPSSTDSMAVLSKMDDADNFRGYDMLLEGGKVAVHMVHQWPGNAVKVMTKQPVSKDAWHHIAMSYDGGHSAASIKIYVDGKAMELDIAQDSLKDSIATDKRFHLGLRQSSIPFRGLIDELQIFDGKLLPEQVAQIFADQPMSNVTEWVDIPADRWTDDQRKQLHVHYRTAIDTEYPMLTQGLNNKQKERKTLEEQLPAVMVMQEMATPRETFVLKRGQYDQPGSRVTANVPAVLSKFEGEKTPGRMELAKWLVDPRNPLTARVAVNRWWQNYFGVGLVKTAEDFGITGESPSHPELLDYLATRLIESHWNVKELQKLIVMSATYQQSSRISPELLERDPENRLLARGARYRLPAETVRDNALAISGLLKERVGGPSVKPYQPAGLWEDVTVERRGKYVADQGEGLYRRSMYTFWKRTCPPPSMMSFDAPNREVCMARRARTNTPLQSLVLLNDPTYVEASRVLASHLLEGPDRDDANRMHLGFRRCLARDASEQEQKIMQQILVQSRDKFKTNPKLATDLNSIGASTVAESIDPIELASWTVVASTLLNLDETISKR